MSTKKYCTKCGKEMSQDGKFCVSCNAEIKNVDTSDRYIKKSSNSPEKNVAIIALICIITMFILPMFVFINTNSPVIKNEEKKTVNSYKSTEVKEILKENDFVPDEKNNIPTEVNKCSNKNDFIFLEKNYKFFNLNNVDYDIKVDSNEMKVYGIIKNNSSECLAKNIRIKVLIKKGEEIIQEEYLNLENINIYPGKTAGFSEKFEVYESLLNIKNHSRSFKLGMSSGVIIDSINSPTLDEFMNKMRTK